MRKIAYISTLLAILCLFGTAGISYAVSGYLDDFVANYPSAVGTRIDTCLLCHVNPNPGPAARNAYGSAFANAGHVFGAIEGADSDVDGFTNKAEIDALSFPGNPADFPAPPSDTQAPTVDQFAIPATSNSLTVPITTLTATDNILVTGFMVTESAIPPTASDPAWSATAPTSVTFPAGTAPGPKTLFAWAKDAAGNVSTSRSQTVDLIITLTTFADVPADHLFFNQIDAVAAAGITGGCAADDPLTPDNEANFCPDNPVTRGQMAVFLETSLGGVTAACVGTFADVPTTHPFCGFIELLASDGITGGCGGNNYCPDAPVTRGQMAVFIEAALGGVPAACVTTFADVTADHPFCGFIETFATEGITGGCAADNPATTTVNEARFCPDSPVTRGQMAVFLVAAPDPLLP
jgi:hypothetical protein